MSDICAWTAYYDTPLKNCAVAAMELTKTPHMERIALLYLQIRHKGDPRLPVADRFEIMSIGRESVSAFPLRDQSPLCIQPESYAQSCERGKLEMGDDFYGVVRYGLTVVFGPEEKPYAATHKWKHFSIDKTTAQAPSTRPDYWTLFREYVKAGAKMKFCCGKVAESAGICCCGGWVHDEEKQDAFSKIGK
ncbi:hypothetical protein B0H10DRAFT_2222003 [Mycena sp. CBHHK59/15]|nr:hypothetical protein B0H10DRAFT_2222003 [Mycena sp. CBHHK59/15]